MAKVVSISEKPGPASDTRVGGNVRVRLPGPNDRINIIGHTGSGKSQAAMWHLSNANFDVQPWVLIDPKEEEKFAMIDDAEFIDYDTIPRYPGIYVLQTTTYDGDKLDNYFAQLLEAKNVGVYIDESSEAGYGPGFTTFLTRGRSRHCPAITLQQRPVDVSRYTRSEAQFFQCFPLTDNADYKTLRGFAKIPDFDEDPLPEFYSYYYDVRWKRCYRFKPVPHIDQILATIQTKLDARAPRRKVI